MPPTVSNRFTHILPLAWMVPTFYATRPGVVIPQSGAPRIDLADPDLQARAQRMLNVLHWTAQAHANRPGMQDDNTLKVFIAPELYFRKAAKEDTDSAGFIDAGFGIYPDSARYVLAEALYRAIGASPLFNNWTVFAGSICSALPRSGQGTSNLLNTAIVMRCARAAIDASVPYVLSEKHYIANADGGSLQRSASDQSIPYAFRQAPGQDMDNLVHWDGMTQALELGLDHNRQATCNAMNEVSRAIGPGMQGADLQLVASCGMSIVDQAAAVRDGGLVFLVDGHSSLYQRLTEPRSRIGRFDAATGSVVPLGSDTLLLTSLPTDAGHTVDYAQGRYAAEGLRQGVWCSRERIPLKA